MRIVIAPDSFKESMTATEVVAAMERGIRNVCRTCEIVKLPLADGGEGTADILMQDLQAKRFEAEVTGPIGQKVTAKYGITSEGIAIIDVASVIGLQFVPEEKRNPLDIAEIKGAGAAGGLGAAFAVFLRAKVKRGIDYILELTNVEKAIAQADVVLTGEGKTDNQTLYGKVAYGVAHLAKKYGVPTIAIVGTNEVTSNEIYDAGIRAIFPIVNKPMPLYEALKNGEYLTEKAVENVFRLLIKEGGHKLEG